MTTIEPKHELEARRLIEQDNSYELEREDFHNGLTYMCYGYHPGKVRSLNERKR